MAYWQQVINIVLKMWPKIFIDNTLFEDNFMICNYDYLFSSVVFFVNTPRQGWQTLLGHHPRYSRGYWCFVHWLHSNLPQALQWCLRIMKENFVLHSWHWELAWSGTQVGAVLPAGDNCYQTHACTFLPSFGNSWPDSSIVVGILHSYHYNLKLICM